MVRVGYFVFSLWEESQVSSFRNVLSLEQLDENKITSVLKKSFQGLSIPYKIIIPKPIKYNGLNDDWQRTTGFRCAVIVREPCPVPLYLDDETFRTTFLAIQNLTRQTFPELFVPVEIIKEFPVCKLDQILD